MKNKGGKKERRKVNVNVNVNVNGREYIMVEVNMKKDIFISLV